MKRKLSSQPKKSLAPKTPAAETLLQRRRLNTDSSNLVPAIVHEVFHSPGQPLDSATRASMEARFGQDFSRVRVHADDNAAASARAMNANAYTVGQDVVFAAGKYRPETLEGKNLVAHELTHVVQQTALPGTGGSPAQAEIEADLNAANAHSPRVQVGVASGAVQREEAGKSSGAHARDSGNSPEMTLALAMEQGWQEYYDIALQGTTGTAGLKPAEKAELAGKIADEVKLLQLERVSAARAKGEDFPQPDWKRHFQSALQTTSGSTYKPLANKNKAMEAAAKRAVSEAAEIADAAVLVTRQARPRLVNLYKQHPPPDAPKEKPPAPKKKE